MNAKISVFVICVEEIIYLLLYNLHDCTFNNPANKLRINYVFFRHILLTNKGNEKMTT